MNIFKKVFVTLRGVAIHPLNRRAKMRAMTHFCVAQVASRLVPGDICVSFPNSTKLLISPRMKGAAHFICPGLCEFEEMSFVMHFLRPEDLFIDIGANVGAYTVLAGGVAGAKTIAFEPSPSTFAYLQQNLKLNSLEGKASALNVALGSEEGVLQMTEGLGTENYICPSEDSRAKTEVNVITLDKALEASQPTFLKVDVEGFETRVLAGAASTLAKPGLQGLIVERAGNADRYGFDEAALHQRIQALGFFPYAYAPERRALTPLPKDALGNIIYLKNQEEASKRLKEAAAYRFGGAVV